MKDEDHTGRGDIRELGSLLDTTITKADLENACMCYRKDYAGMSVEDQRIISKQAFDWLNAWRKAKPAG